MIGRIVPILFSVLTLTGCAASPADAQAEKLKAGLARVEMQCGVKPGTLKLDSDNLVSVMPAPDAKYETIECAFQELKKPEFADHIKLGFVGNEMHPREEQK